MRIWLRIFILTTAVAIVAIALIGVISLRTGYRALLDGEIRLLTRDSRNAAALIAGQFQAIQRLFWSAGTLPFASASPVADFLRESEGLMRGISSSVEVFSATGDFLYSERSPSFGPHSSLRPEIAAAKGGETVYMIRRVDSIPTLFLAAEARIFDERFIMSVNTPLEALDAYRRTQTSYLLLTATGAALLLSGASFLGSRTIARRLVALSAQASAIAEGDFHRRADIKGRDEVADLASRVNMMASEVERRIERLRSEKEDRQRFIDSLTHELRTPVTSIVGFAEHLRQRKYDEKVFSRGLDRIHDEGLKILRLSESLKRLLIMRTVARELASISVPTFLERLASQTRERFPARSADITVQADPGELDADPELIATAMLNLIDNAVRASAEGSPIVIGFRVKDAERILFVIDHGPGMNSSNEGFGLGLSICREIAEYHDARLEIQSPSDGGTSARLVFKNLPKVYPTETDP